MKQVLFLEIDPLNNRNNSKPTTSWVAVVLFLIAVPFAMSLFGSMWLGVPKESHQGDELFSRLDLKPVPLSERESLLYGKLFFCRLRFEPEHLGEFLAQLEDFDSKTGTPEKPISLQLERAWWDPNPQSEGRFFVKGALTLWSPLQEPELFYGVVSGQSAGVKEEATKSQK